MASVLLVVFMLYQFTCLCHVARGYEEAVRQDEKSEGEVGVFMSISSG